MEGSCGRNFEQTDTRRKRIGERKRRCSDTCRNDVGWKCKRSTRNQGLLKPRYCYGGQANLG